MRVADGKMPLSLRTADDPPLCTFCTRPLPRRIGPRVLVLLRRCGAADFTFANIPRYYYWLATHKSTQIKESRRNAASESLRFLTVGQTARILGISSSTLRLWEGRSCDSGAKRR